MPVYLYRHVSLNFDEVCPRKRTKIISSAQEVHLEHASSHNHYMAASNQIVFSSTKNPSLTKLCIPTVLHIFEPLQASTKWIQQHTSTPPDVWSQKCLICGTQNSTQQKAASFSMTSGAKCCNALPSNFTCYSMLWTFPKVVTSHAEDMKNKDTIINGCGLVPKKSTTWTKSMFRRSMKIHPVTVTQRF